MSRNPARRRHWLARAAWIPALLVALAALAVATSGASARSGTPDSLLLQTYQPVLVLHASELFRPTKIQSFVEDSELEQLVAANPLADSSWQVVDADPEPGELGSLPPGVYRLDQTSCEADAPGAGSGCYAAAWSEGSGGDAVYGRVVRTETAIMLQYWLFYYDNPFFLPAPLSAFWQSHEGDWELVNVILGMDEEPLQAAYSQHCTGQRKAWGSVEKSPAGSTHPVAYVALGSHANYFAPGLHPVASACVPSFVPAQLRSAILDQTAAGPSVGPTGTDLDGATIHRIDGTGWASFGGRWGESEYFFAPGLTTVPLAFGPAPASPANQGTWSASTVLGWPLS